MNTAVTHLALLEILNYFLIHSNQFNAILFAIA